MRSFHILWPLLAALTFGPAAVADEDENGRGPKMEDTPKLTVRGEAELEKPADQLRLSIGVVTEGPEAGRTLTENSELMIDVIEAIEDAGLTSNEYQSGRFRIRPQYSRRPRQPQPDWQPQIIGYEVVNSIAVKTKKLDLAGELIEAANKAGANTVEVTGFDLADPRMYRAEAIREATKNAREDAAALADAADLRLGKILLANIDHTPVRAVELDYARGRVMAEGAAAPPVSPGNVTVTATVTLVYEIFPREGE